MIKKYAGWVCGIVLLGAFSSPAAADQSLGFKQYFKEGIRAYQSHDDQRALHCFKIAHIYDPADQQVNEYLSILEQRGVVLEINLSKPPENSIGYVYYFNGGVKAFRLHDDEKATRYFKIAKIFWPGSKDADHYLILLGVPQEELPPSKFVMPALPPRPQMPSFPQINIPPPEVVTPFVPNVQPQNITPQEVQPQPTEVVQQPSEVKQLTPQSPIQVSSPSRNFNATPVAQVNASAPEQQTAQQEPLQAASSVVAPNIPAGTAAVTQPLTNTSGIIQPASVSVPSPSMVSSPIYPRPQASTAPEAMAFAPLSVPSPAPQMPRPNVYVGALKPKQPPMEIYLEQLGNKAHGKSVLTLELHSSVILIGKNIHRVLMIDQGFIQVHALGTDRLQVDAVGIGTTFLHIWDDFGRHTLYIEVVFPKNTGYGENQPSGSVQHSAPFLVTYTNDYGTFYSGPNASKLKRESFNFNQTLTVTGETPYGYFDTSGSYTDFESYSQFDTYTIGLSQIPLEGVNNFNLRGFDAFRYLSPLTMPGTRLRGVFADVDLLGNMLGVSVSHGQEQEPIGFIGTNSASQFNNSYIDAVKLTLFPESSTDHYSLNYAVGYGSDRQPYLTKDVYSVEAHHKFNDFLTFNAEEGHDDSHDATLASLHWDKPDFKTGFNFRNIDKSYTTISTYPANQGETGGTWTTDTLYKNITADTFLEAYQEHLDPNANHPSALNYDGNGHLRDDIAKNWWTDTDFNFLDTPGELSAQRTYEVNQRLSKSVHVWNGLSATVFGGVGYQDNTTPGSDISDYYREDAIVGVQLPITNEVSTYANYEYDWFHLKDQGTSNPNVINTGIEYSKQFNPKVSFTSQVDYRDELGVNESNSIFLSGERSVILSASVNYNPTNNLSVFADTSATRIISHLDNPSYDDFEVHIGMRITFGGATYWDPVGIITGIVFKDVSGDGKYEPGDEGIPGVKLKVGNKDVTTDKYGRYSIKISAKAVEVTPVLDSLPGGLIFSSPQTLVVHILQGRKSHADFGFISQTGIYGLVFVDPTGTGVPRSTDKFVPKVHIILDGKISQRSDSHGAFYFRKVAPGDHIISIDLNTLPLDMVPRIKLKNKITVVDGTNYVFNVPVQIKEANSSDE